MSGILTNVCLGTSRTLRLSSFFFSFFRISCLLYCCVVFLSWTNKRIIEWRVVCFRKLLAIVSQRLQRIFNGKGDIVIAGAIDESLMAGDTFQLALLFLPSGDSSWKEFLMWHRHAQTTRRAARMPIAVAVLFLKQCYFSWHFAAYTHINSLHVVDAVF